MRIVAWMETHYPVIGGIQTAARQLLPALRERGHEVVVVTSHYAVQMPDMMVLDGVPIYRFNFHDILVNRDPLVFIQERQRLTTFLCEFAPDIVHVMGFCLNAVFFLRSRQKHNLPFLYTLHNDESILHGDTTRYTLMQQLLTEADWITTVSQVEADRFAKLIPEIAPKISCVYQGLAEPKEPRQPLPTSPRLLCIGRIEKQKNVGLAIQAFARIASAFPDARLLLGGDGSERPSLEQLVIDLAIADRVDFLGWVQPEQVFALINQASIVLLPSRWEGLPLVGVEAAQMGRPVIATRVSGTPELVIDGETGLLTPSEDVDAMAAALYALLSDPERTAQMGEAAHANINRKFGLPAMVDGFYELYERIVATAAVSAATPK